MILTFGEIMLRVSTPDRLRLRQCVPGAMDMTFGGGEANVAVSLAHLGNDVAFMTALPDNAITECCLADLRRYGVATDRIRIHELGRFGIYFVETGSNQRPSVVVYDRAHSTISQLAAAEYDFAAALEGVTWVHTTGITPSLSQAAFDATLALVKTAQDRDIPVSLDLNFRKKLWRWQPGTNPRDLAEQSMRQILPHVSLVIGNEEDASDVLGIAAKDTSVDAGQINADAYREVAREIARQFPAVKHVAITLRESISADHNNWGAMLYQTADDQAYLAPLDANGAYRPYEIRNIVDRVGGGDSFGAGLIHALRSKAYSAPELAIRFAVAASALKHTIKGDFNLSSEKEVDALLHGSGSGRVQR